MKRCVITVLLMIFMLFITSCGDKLNTPADNENGDADTDTVTDEEQDNQSDNDSWDYFEEPVINPSGNIPLSASVDLWLIKSPASVSVSIKDIDGKSEDFIREYSLEGLSDWASIPVLGLFPDHENTVTLKALDKEGGVIIEKEFKIKTSALPDDFPVVTMEGTIDSGWTIVNWSRTPNSRPELIGIALDELGRIRWYTDFPFPAAFPITLNGNTFYTSDGGDNLYHFDFMGNQLETWDVSTLGFNGIHHEIFIKDDGNLILGVNKKDSDWIEDRMIEINPVTDQLRGTWDLNRTFPDVCDLYNDIPLTSTETPGTTNDPIHNNGAWYDPDDDTLLIGSQRSGIGLLTHSGYLKWFLAPHITAYIDDADNDGLSDSLVDGYDAEDPATRVGDFKGAGYINDRMPIAGKPYEDYAQLDWKYPEFLLTPLDKNGDEITDPDVLKGFKDHEDFAWPFRAHTPAVLKNGNIMVFDNGLGRNFSYPPLSPNHYSRVVEYKIVSDKSDGYGGTIQQVWEFVFEADPMWYAYSPVVGGAFELENGNILAVSGSLGTAFLPEILMNMYGNGPFGALVVEIDKETAEELNRLSFERVIDADHQNTEFSIYRANRFELTGVLK